MEQGTSWLCEPDSKQNTFLTIFEFAIATDVSFTAMSSKKCSEHFHATSIFYICDEFSEASVNHSNRSTCTKDVPYLAYVTKYKPDETCFYNVLMSYKTINYY